MKKILIVLTLLLLLTGCKENDNPSNEWVVLPDLNGFNELQIIEHLDLLNATYTIEYYDEQSQTYSLQFIMYQNHNIGDIVSTDEEVVVVVYEEYQPTSIIELPDFTGLTQEEVLNQMLNSTINYYFEDVDTMDPLMNDYFAGYAGGYQAGDMFDTVSALGILIHHFEEEVTEEYFQVLDLPYNGPYLDETYATIDYMDPRGGYFEVTLQSCTDGDTAKFNYPNDIYEAIQSGAKSTRFLNMDTEETYWGGEEEWGKPASVYTCDLLESADSIILQTDPGDGLLDTYGRLLSWIWIQLPAENEYFLLNYMVVYQGLAQVKYEFGAGLDLSYGDYSYNEWMHIAEDYAIANNLGQWGDLLDYYWDYENEQPHYDRWTN